MAPTPENVLAGHENIKGLVRGTLEVKTEKKTYVTAPLLLLLLLPSPLLVLLIRSRPPPLLHLILLLLPLLLLQTNRPHLPGTA